MEINCLVLCTVGVLLDKTGSSTGEGDTWRNVSAHPFDPTREESSVSTTRVVSEGRGRVHVRLHGVRVHGVDGVLPGKYRTRRFGSTGGKAGTSTCAAILQRHGYREARQDLRHCH